MRPFGDVGRQQRVADAAHIIFADRKQLEDILTGGSVADLGVTRNMGSGRA
jgi:hypothetical protein